MILHYFKKSHVLLYFPVLLLFAALFLLQYLASPQQVLNSNDFDNGFIFKYIITSIASDSFVLPIITFILYAFTGIFINHVANVNMLLQQRTLLPSLFFLLLIASNQNFITFIPVMFSALFLVLVLSVLFQFYNNPGNYIKLFDLGFFIALSSFFYIPSVFFILFIFAALFVYHELSIRNILIAISGVITPYLFVFTYLFWHNSITYGIFLELIEHFKLVIPQFQFQANEIIMAGMVALIFLLSFFRIIITQIEKVIKIRKYNFVLIWFIIIALIGLFFSHNNFQHFVFLIIPIAYFFSNFFLSIRRTRIAEILFTLFLAIIILTKFL